MRDWKLVVGLSGDVCSVILSYSMFYETCKHYGFIANSFYDKVYKQTFKITKTISSCMAKWLSKFENFVFMVNTFNLSNN